DPGGSGARAIELGRHSGRGDAVAGLRDGRVVTTGGGYLRGLGMGRPGGTDQPGRDDPENRADAGVKGGAGVSRGDDSGRAGQEPLERADAYRSGTQLVPETAESNWGRGPSRCGQWECWPTDG